MIITSLSIHNFGVYRGTNDFELRPRQDGNEFIPVVLFGGKNGAGKTTILEAIRVCLYGRLVLGNRVRRMDYDAYIMQRIHRGSAHTIPAKVARVGLVFEHVHAGVLSTYDAVRSWHIEGPSINETISIYKDGQPMRDIAPEHWDDFLRDLIPPGIADLFFFDGEQIQALAQEETESAALATAMNGLLKLDLVDRLKSDLVLYAKQQGNQERSLLEVKLDALSQEYDVIEKDIEKKHKERAYLMTQSDRIQKQLDDARQSLLQEGAGFVHQRSAMEKRQIEVERLIEQTRNSVRDLAAELLPFSVAPMWTQRLQQRLHMETQSEQAQIVYASQKAKAAEVATQLLDPQVQRQVKADFSAKEWAEIASLVSSLQPQEEFSATLLHPISTQKRAQLQDWVKRALYELPAETLQLGKQLEALEQERNALQRTLRQIPEDQLAVPLIDQFYKFSEQRGGLIEQIKVLDEELGLLERSKAETERQRRKVWQQLSESGDVDQRMQRAAKVQIILDEYLERITAVKTRELETRVAYYFNLLCRKQMFVHEVAINAERYTVTLYGENRTELPKSSLSAGERQLYAMSLLWALRSISGRMLPIIVDTPMGRLDSEHRATLLKHFFPHAAHQLILLSTDTEINPETYALLKPAISHVFLLDYNVEQGCTTVERRYFSDKAEEVTA